MLRLGLRFAPAAATPPGVRVRRVKLPRTNRAMRLVTSISANCPATSAISRQAQTAVFRDLSGSLRATGVTPGEFSLLAMLRANPDINSITLATHQLDKATLSLSIEARQRGLPLEPRRRRPPLLFLRLT